MHEIKRTYSYDWDGMANMLDNEPTLIAAKTVQSKRNDPNTEYIIVDVREDDELQKSKLDQNDWIHVPKDSILSKQSAEEMMEMGLDTSKYKDIYILCRTGHRANLVAEHLKDLGIKNVSVIEGGLLSWRDSELNT